MNQCNSSGNGPNTGNCQTCLTGCEAGFPPAMQALPCTDPMSACMMCTQSTCQAGCTAPNCAQQCASQCPQPPTPPNPHHPPHHPHHPPCPPGSCGGNNCPPCVCDGVCGHPNCAPCPPPPPPPPGPNCGVPGPNNPNFACCNCLQAGGDNITCSIPCGPNPPPIPGPGLDCPTCEGTCAAQEGCSFTTNFNNCINFTGYFNCVNSSCQTVCPKLCQKWKYRCANGTGVCVNPVNYTCTLGVETQNGVVNNDACDCIKNTPLAGTGAPMCTNSESGSTAVTATSCHYRVQTGALIANPGIGGGNP